MNPLDMTALFMKHLRALERWIDKAQTNAKERGFKGDVLTHARLAPDQYSFTRQIQAACDTAKLTTAKLAGVEPPVHADEEKTLDQLKARLFTCLAYLETFTADQFVGWEERRCVHSWMGDKWMRGADYQQQYGLPNFFFHVMTAYSILRHNGIPLGKPDYLAPLSLQG
jgi:uncharacterized protein